MYYIEEDGKIVLYNTVRKKLKAAMDCMPQYKDLTIQSADREIVVYKGNFYFPIFSNFFLRITPVFKKHLRFSKMT